MKSDDDDIATIIIANQFELVNSSGVPVADFGVNPNTLDPALIFHHLDPTEVGDSYLDWTAGVGGVGAQHSLLLAGPQGIAASSALPFVQLVHPIDAGKDKAKAFIGAIGNSGFDLATLDLQYTTAQNPHVVLRAEHATTAKRARLVLDAQAASSSADLDGGDALTLEGVNGITATSSVGGVTLQAAAGVTATASAGPITLIPSTSVVLQPATSVVLGARTARLMVDRGFVNQNANLVLGAVMTDLPGLTITLTLAIGDVVEIQGFADLLNAGAISSANVQLLVGGVVQTGTFGHTNGAGGRSSVGRVWEFVAAAAGATIIKLQANQTGGGWTASQINGTLAVQVFATK